MAFDATALTSGGTGVARYVRELALGLPAHGVDLVPFAIGRGPLPTGVPSVRRIRVPLRVAHGAWNIVSQPRAEVLAKRCALVHSTDLIPPPTRRPLVMTVHDLDALNFPSLHPPRATRIQRRQLAAARDRADVVLTSPATAMVLQAEGADPDRIVVTPYGVTTLPNAEFTATPEDPFLLVVGALTPRKGQDGLARALAAARLPGVRLVLAGPDGWQASLVRVAIEAAHLGDRVVVTGRITDAQLAGLYRRCLAVCVPSISEGFGIPILEAAAEGCPIVASDIPATRALEPAITRFVPVGDEEAWASALEHVVDDDASRRHARERGPAFAAEYTWDRVAEVTAAAYARALSTASSR